MQKVRYASRKGTRILDIRESGLVGFQGTYDEYLSSRQFADGQAIRRRLSVQ